MLKELSNGSLKLIFFIISISIFSYSVDADLMGISLDVKEAGINLDQGNITIEIWTSASGGALIYNSTGDFIDNVTQGKVDIVLGGSTQAVPLNLTYGGTYFMEVYINNNDINFSGFDRQEFQSSVGNITFNNINVSTSIIPDDNITLDLGSASTYFKNLFVSTLNILTKITTAQIADNAITSALIAARTITSDDIADNAINTTHIADSTILASDLDSALDISNYTAGSSISVADHIISLVFDIPALLWGNETSIINTTHIAEATILPEDISSVGWTNLSDYPGACPAGQAVTAVGDTLTCAAVSSISGSDILWSNETNIINTTHIVDATILDDDLNLADITLADFTNDANFITDVDIINSTMLNASYVKKTGDTITGTVIIEGELNITQGINLSQYASCTALETDSNGNLVCGTDDNTGTNISLNYVLNESSNDWIGALASDEGVMKLDITSLSAERSENNFTSTDSLLADYIYPNSLTTINLDNITVLKDVTILGTLYGGSPLKIGNDIQLTGNLTDSTGNVIISNDATGNLTVEDSFNIDYIYSRTNPVTQINNLSILQDLRVLGTLYGDGSQLTGISAGGMDYTNIAMLNSTSDQTFVGNVSFADNLTVGSALYVDSSNSRVGIGTTSPSALLDVYGASNLDLNVSGNLYANSTNVGIGTASPAHKVHIIGSMGMPSAGVGVGILRVIGSGGDQTLDFGSADVSPWGTWIQSRNQANNGALPLLLQPSGNNVGIGTTAPTHALNVVGDINATGNIYKSGGTQLDWVFDKYFDGKVKKEDINNSIGYEFIPLSELKSYLETNRHLPGLNKELYAGPGEIEISLLPELLLQKTEEQALYIIQLNDAIQEQQKIIEAQEARLQTLEDAQTKKP